MLFPRSVYLQFHVPSFTEVPISPVCVLFWYFNVDYTAAIHLVRAGNFLSFLHFFLQSASPISLAAAAHLAGII